MSTAPTRLGLPAPLTETGIVAILRGGVEAHLYPAAVCLIEAGIRCLEITTNTDGAFPTVARLQREFGEGVAIGVGTVTTLEHVDATADAGGTFIVAPNFDAAVGARATERGLGWYPGTLTPTEILAAWTAGATAAKVFPASAVGGPEYFRQVLAPLDSVLMMPTGGVALDSIPEYLRAGAVAVGLGSPLVGDALTGGDLGQLRLRAEKALAAVREGWAS